MIKACLIIVIGDVQGVFYRHHTKKEAQKLGLSGWAKNEQDGSVTIFAQGEEAKVEKMIEWAKEGSPMAAVKNVEIVNADLTEGLEGFTIK